MKDQLLKIAQFIQKNTQADDYELFVYSNETQNTRFAQNSVTQHITGNYIEVTYRCVIDQKIGVVSTRQINHENLLFTIQQAEEIARNNSPDQYASLSMPKESFKKVNNFYSSVEKLDTAQMIATIKKCIHFAETKKANLSGILSKYINHQVFLTKNGFQGYSCNTEAEISMTLSKDHIETNVSLSNTDFNKINIDHILMQLGEQFDSLTIIKEMDYETIPVILRPLAVYQLFSYLYWLFDRKNADEGLTPFTDKINKVVFGKKFSFLSSMEDQDLLLNAFSSNNVSQTTQWIKEGKILHMPTDKYWAQKNKLQPSQIFNFIIEGEGISEINMMKKVKRGLIINNLWYIRLNDLKTADLTGMTRDGVMYFENGKIQNAVNNFRFNEQLHEITKRIIATGKCVQIDSKVKVPSILIDKFHFVDKTSF